MPTKDFEELAKKHFAFLETSFGFVRRTLTESMLRYEKHNVYVLIGYDSNLSYELSVDLGKTDSITGVPYNFGEVLRSAEAPREVRSSYQATSDQALDKYLKRLAQALWKYGADFLRNDPAAFARLAKLRDKEVEEFALASRMRYARLTLEVAWNARDYKTIVETLEPFKDRLTLAEKKRLEYSQKHLDIWSKR